MWTYPAHLNLKENIQSNHNLKKNQYLFHFFVQSFFFTNTVCIKTIGRKFLWDADTDLQVLKLPECGVKNPPMDDDVARLVLKSVSME